MVSITYRRTKKWYFCSKPFKVRRQIMKKTLNIFLIAALLIPFAFSPASAGPRNNHLLEAVIIGTGVAILSSALIHDVHYNNRKNYYTSYNYHSRKYRGWQKLRPIYHQRYQDFNRYKGRGHWVIKKVWIAPIYKNRLRPGHHIKQGRRIKGRYERIIDRKGYWEKRRVWMHSDR